jgi:Lon protease-like protein
VSSGERLPLFLLHTVLIPGAQLPLKVFEARYLDMVSECLKTGQPFGVCLIKSGREVGDAGKPHAVGTLAHIEQWEMPVPGVLHILVRGGERFAIVRTHVDGQLVSADVDRWDPEPERAIPDRYEALARFLRELFAQAGEAPAEARFDDAGWVSWQLAAVLPVANTVKQQWLALRDPLERLAAILEELTRLAEPGDRGGH